MIRSVKIHDPSKTVIDWLPKIKNFPTEFKFSPGLNVIWGKNGSGKSSLIRLLAKMFHCEQSGDQVVTGDSFREIRGPKRRTIEELRAGVTIDHDGGCVQFCDPSQAVGLIGGMAGFDEDFFGLGVSNAMFRGSAGETTNYRFNKLLGDLVNKKTPAIYWKQNPHEKEWVDYLTEFLAGSGDKGPRTVILDEAEKSLDIPTQVILWRFMIDFSKNTQFIVATHSPWAVMLPDVNYVELTSGYLTQASCWVAAMDRWPMEKPEDWHGKNSNNKPEPKKEEPKKEEPKAIPPDEVTDAIPKRGFCEDLPGVSGKRAKAQREQREKKAKKK